MSMQLTFYAVSESIFQDEECRLGYANAHYGRVDLEEHACVYYLYVCVYMPCIIVARLEKFKGPR